MFPFCAITELGEVTSHCSPDTDLWGANPGGAVVKTQDYSISCLHGAACNPVPGGGRGEKGGAGIKGAPLFFLLISCLRLHLEQCACVIFPRNFLSAASLAGEGARGP